VGVESDRMVFDYLSRVGDLAQTAMPAAQRMQLVAQLRKDIDRERRDADSAADVRRILGRLGSPDEVVEAASGGGGGGERAGAAEEPPAREPAPGSYGPYTKAAGPGGDAPKGVPRPRRRASGAPGEEWWQGDGDTGGGRLRPGDELLGLPGMTGGIFIPDDDEELDPADAPAAVAAAEEPEEAPVEEDAVERAPRRRLLPRLARAGGRGARGWGSPVLLIAAGLLVAGVVTGSLIPLGLGWVAPWLSRRLTRPQAKFAVLVIPGAFAAGMVVWVWGRDVGKWGDPIAQGQVGQAFQDAYPLTVRLAALGSALYLLWRARRSA
jgi:hypothetical protein